MCNINIKRKMQCCCCSPAARHVTIVSYALAGKIGDDNLKRYK